MEAAPDTGSETDLANLESSIEAVSTVQLILRWSKGMEVRSLSDGEAVTFGRSRDATLTIPDSRVSRLHASIRVEERAVWVEDLGSRNGTFVGRHHLRREKRRAVGGDLVRIGPLDIVVAVTGGSASPEHAGENIVVADPSMRHVFEVSRRLALTQTTVLITGETGAGKEVVAEQIHRWSSRRDGPFVRIDCASVSPSLLDTRLNGGTVLFDEVGELSLETQAKLLSFLEHPRIDQAPLDVRILCATHRDLEADVAQGKFRRDLYYRINTFVLRVPPLRERREEILLLADHYAKELSKKLDIPSPAIDASACAALTAHHWPGNVRELRNAMEHAMVLATDGVVRREHLPDSVLAKTSETDDPGKLLDQLSGVEKKSIEDALRLEGGNQTRAAKRLGITRRALIYRIERLGLRKS